jgi:hypothetical protein
MNQEKYPAGWGRNYYRDIIMKRIFFIFTVFFTLASASGVEQKVYTPHNTIFLWDLHDVILERDLPSMIRLVWKYPHTWEILKRINSTLLLGTLKLSMLSLLKLEGLGTEFVALTEQAHNPFMGDLFIKIVNTQKPNKGTVELIKELHDLGYAHHIGSNIDETIFKELTNPQKNPQFESLFSLFDLQKSQVVKYGSNIIKKPNIKYYSEYLTKNNIDPTKTHVIFIDDMKANVEAAQKAGMIGIRFISPAQVRRGLEKMNILPIHEPVTVPL